MSFSTKGAQNKEEDVLGDELCQVMRGSACLDSVVIALLPCDFRTVAAEERPAVGSSSSQKESTNCTRQGGSRLCWPTKEVPQQDSSNWVCAMFSLVMAP